MDKFVDYLTYGFIAVFALPTVMIMASWNSVPGDATYVMKRAFESAALVLAKPSYDAQTSLNEQYTKRRLEEAKVLLASHQSTEGLTYLSQQITATKAMIQNAPTQEKKQEAAKKYITTLKSVSTELKAQKAKSSGNLALKTSTKTTTKTTSSGGTSQAELQAQLQKQIQQVQELQQSLESQLQQPQSEQLMAQLQAQASQLRQLQQQVQQGQVTAQTVQNQIQQQVQQTDTIQEQIQEQSPGTNDQTAADEVISDTEDQVDSAIEELEALAQASSIQESNDPMPTGVQDSGSGGGASPNGGNNTQQNSIQDQIDAAKKQDWKERKKDNED